MLACVYAETSNYRDSCVVHDGLLNKYIDWSEHNGDDSLKDCQGNLIQRMCLEALAVGMVKSIQNFT